MTIIETSRNITVAVSNKHTLKYINCILSNDNHLLRTITLEEGILSKFEIKWDSKEDLN